MSELATAHETKVYPPRFSYIVLCGEENEKVQFIFTGLQHPKKYEVILESSVAGMHFYNYDYFLYGLCCSFHR